MITLKAILHTDQDVQGISPFNKNDNLFKDQE